MQTDTSRSESELACYLILSRLVDWLSLRSLLFGLLARNGSNPRIGVLCAYTAISNVISNIMFKILGIFHSILIAQVVR